VRTAVNDNDIVCALLPDGIVMDKPQRVARMAAALCTYQATANYSDATRCLMGRGFGYGEIVAYLDDALFEARQGKVAAIVRTG
jgi:hypothetical protein